MKTIATLTHVDHNNTTNAITNSTGKARLNTLGNVHELDIVATGVGFESLGNVPLLTDYLETTQQPYAAFLLGTRRDSTAW